MWYYMLIVPQAYRWSVWRTLLFSTLDITSNGREEVVSHRVWETFGWEQWHGVCMLLFRKKEGKCACFKRYLDHVCVCLCACGCVCVFVCVCVSVPSILFNLSNLIYNLRFVFHRHQRCRGHLRKRHTTNHLFIAIFMWRFSILNI